MEDRFFKYAVIVSLLLHGVLFVRLYTTPKKEFPRKEAELSYRIAPRPTPQADAYAQVMKQTAVMPAGAPGEQVKVDSPGDQAMKALSREGLDLEAQFKVFEREPEKVKGLKVTKEVSMPMLKSEKINTPAYATYYQIVRDRIRERAYTNFTKLSMGEIYLTIIIKADGSLAQLQVMENNSAANDFLRDVGMSSVKAAAPFPPFPQDLNYPELTFNVQISFQFREE